MSSTPRSYPPYGHILRHLRLDLVSESNDALTCVMPVTDDLRDAGGALRTGALVTMIDVAAGTFSHDLVRPDWLATSDMKFHLMRPIFGDRVATRTTSLRAGKRSSLSLTVAADEQGELARSWVTYVRLPRRDDSPTIEQGDLTGRRLHYVEEPEIADAPRPMLDDYIGIEIRPDELTLDLVHHPRIHNSFGSIQGGVASTLIERMTLEAGLRTWARPARVIDLHVYFLGQTRDGPFQVNGTVLRADEDSITVEASVIDAANGRVLDLGTATAIPA